MIKIILHCSDSTFGNAVQIDNWHRTRKPPFKMIGYHYVILNCWLTPTCYNSYFEGTIETGRPLDDDSSMELCESGAHAFGYNNAVGICLIGKSGKFSFSQINSLKHLIDHLRTQFKEITVLQHSDVDPINKPHCAGLSKEFMLGLNNQIPLYQGS